MYRGNLVDGAVSSVLPGVRMMSRCATATGTAAVCAPSPGPSAVDASGSPLRASTRWPVAGFVIPRVPAAAGAQSPDGRRRGGEHVVPGRVGRGDAPGPAGRQPEATDPGGQHQPPDRGV